MNETKLSFLVSGILLAVLLLMSVFAVVQETRSTRAFIRDRELPALGLAVSAQLDLAANRYLRAGEDLLEDGYIRDWILAGEEDVPGLVSFMESVRERHKLLDASIVSDRTETYYGTDGRVLRLDPQNWERDGWYYLYRHERQDRNLDCWFYPETDIFTIYVNVPILDRNGDFLGVTGGGIESERFAELMHSFEHEQDLTLYLARRDGQLVYASDIDLLREGNMSLNHLWGERFHDQLWRSMNESVGLVLEPETRPGSVLWARFIRDWDTFLIVERSPQSLQKTLFARALSSSIASAIVITALFLLATLFIRLMERRISHRLQTSKVDLARAQALLWLETQGARGIATQLERVREELSANPSTRAQANRLGTLLDEYEDLRQLATEREGTDEEGAHLEEGMLMAEALREIVLRYSPRAQAKGIRIHNNEVEVWLERRQASLCALALGAQIDACIESSGQTLSSAIIIDIHDRPFCLDLALPHDCPTCRKNATMLESLFEAQGLVIERLASSEASVIYRIKEREERSINA